MSQSISFEKQLSELETLVSSLEKGDLSLEDALKKFEQGITLASSCQTTLKQAELKISQLQSQSNTLNLDDQDDRRT